LGEDRKGVREDDKLLDFWGCVPRGYCVALHPKQNPLRDDHGSSWGAWSGWQAGAESMDDSSGEKRPDASVGTGGGGVRRIDQPHCESTF
jgi:hypothetical protein